MRRFRIAAAGILGFGLLLVARPPASFAADIAWNTANNGNWEVGTNWVGGNTPGNNDSATLNANGTYTITFGINPASIQRLIASAGTVTLQSNGTLKTLGIDAAGGNDSLFVLGSSTVLNLGGSSGNAMALNVPVTIAIGSGGSFVVRSGSSVNDFGTLQIGQVVNGVTTPSTSSFTLQSGSTMTLGGDLLLATQSVAGMNGAMLVNNSGSVLTQFGNANMTIGSFANGTGSLTISNSGVVTTGTGLLTINKTGNVTMNTGSTLNANGNILINGGLLTGAGVFNWVADSTMAINNGNNLTPNGVSLSSTFTTPANSIINVSGFASQFQITGSSNDLNINNGGAVNIASLSSLAVGDIISVGTAGAGTLSVNGIGATATAAGTGLPSVFGSAGGIAIVTYSNQATGTFNSGINMALGTGNAPNAQAYLTIQSGASLNGVGNIAMATSSNIATTASITVTDSGSALTLANSKTLTIGQASAGKATINVNNQGLLSLGTGGTTTLNASGTININGGTVNLQTLVNNGGKFNFNSGSLNYLGNLTVGSGGLLGTNLTLDDTKQLTLSGTTTVNAGSFLLVQSGTSYSTGTLANSGEFILDGVNAIANITGSTAVTNSGLIRGQGTILLPTNSNGFTNTSTGEIRAEDGKRVVIKGATGGLISNSGKINLLGGTVEIGQPITNSSTGLISGRGNLIITPFFPAGPALTNNGNVAFSSGITSVFGDVSNNTSSATVGITITGNSNVTFWDDVTNVAPSLFKVTPGSSVTIFGTYSGGSITGGGQMNFDGDLSPGSSPAAITIDGNALLASTARLKIELGGTTAGTQYDQVNVTGNLNIQNSTLQVLLINGFVPHAGDVFHILNWGSLTGSFATVQFPTVAGLSFSTQQLYTTGNLAVFSNKLGDFNQDGHVNNADIPAMMSALTDLNAYETSRSLGASDLLSIGDLDHSGDITNADLQGLLDLLKSGGGSTTAVPEPTTLALFAPVLVIGLTIRFARRQRR